MSKTSIEWTDQSWNPILAKNKNNPGKELKRGYGSGTGHYCEKISAGCKNCYAEGQQPRFGNPIKYSAAYLKDVDVYLDEEVLMQPLKWKKPSKIFVCDMSDLFGEWVPMETIYRVFEIMTLAQWHTFQVLTKRPKRMQEFYLYYCNRKRMEYLGTLHAKTQIVFAQNIWLGVSVENQQAADERIPLLVQIPAAVKFLSCEPLLGPINLEKEYPVGKGSVPFGLLMNWIIVGGESGPNSRPMHPNWPISLHDQCARYAIPFFFKQWGNYTPHFEHELTIESSITEVEIDLDGKIIPAGTNPFSMTMVKTHKKKSGNILLNKQHLAFPTL